MFFKTPDECREMVKALGLDANSVDASAPDPRFPSITVFYENSPRASVQISRNAVSWLTDFPVCLLWITEWGVWGTENLHLYYRLRASYGDLRQLIDAPGHAFHSYEKSDLITFLEVAIHFGWGGHLLYAPDWPRVFFSHDGWMRIWPGSARDRILEDLDRMHLPFQIDGEG